MNPGVRPIAARVGLLSLFANLAGALLTFVFLTYLIPAGDEHAQAGDRLVSISVLIIYLLLTASAGFLMGRRRFTSIGSWAHGPDAIPPSVEARDEVLNLPSEVATRSFFFWLGAAVLFTTLNTAFDNTAFELARIAVGIVIAGLTTAALTFLLSERVMRPLVASALAGEAPPEEGRLGVRTRLVLAWLLGSGLPFASIAAVISSPDRTAEEMAAPVLFLIGVGLVAGGLLVLVSARALSDPLRQLRAAVGRVAAGDLEVAVPVDDGGEVGRLQAGLNAMTAGLRQRRELEDLFGRHVGHDVARQALSRQALGGEQLEASALFVDLVDSTRLAVEKSPAEVVSILNDFFAAVVSVVSEEGGWVNKFQGDGALCVFGAPQTCDDHATRALRTVRRLRSALDDLAREHAGLQAGVGVSSGPVVAGNVGAESRYEFTVIGDPVNEAARLTEAAKAEPLMVLASEQTVARASPEEAARWSAPRVFALRGRTSPSPACSIAR